MATLPDHVKDQALPRPDIAVVRPLIGRVEVRPYMTAAMVDLLALIRQHEAGRGGYNADYRNDDRFPLTTSTFDQAYRFARSQVSDGEASSAIGAYQFISTTLASLKESLKLTGAEMFNETFQDDLAVALMIRRGYQDFMRHNIDVMVFCNNLAKEWASLPVVTPIRGAHRQLQVGQSYYAGDGLNAALVDPDDFMDAVAALRVAVAPVPLPKPPVTRTDPRPNGGGLAGLLRDFADWLRSYLPKKD